MPIKKKKNYHSKINVIIKNTLDKYYATYHYKMLFVIILIHR